MASAATMGAMETILALGLPDQAIQADELPWVPQGEYVWFKPLRFELATGRWINLLKVTKRGRVNRHRHSGGQVLGYVIQGSWRYLEREWVARPGTLVDEPPGDIHTLVVDGAEEMLTLFILEGVIQYLDDADNVIYQDDVFTKLDRYLTYCKREGIAPRELCFCRRAQGIEAGLPGQFAGEARANRRALARGSERPTLIPISRLKAGGGRVEAAMNFQVRR